MSAFCSRPGPSAATLPSGNAETLGDFSTRRIRTYNRDMGAAGRGREEMERRYGKVESGDRTIPVRGVPYRLRDVLARWMMDVPEIMTLDGGTLAEDRHWIRFIDKEDRTYVVFEFNGEFDILTEMRVDSLEWEGEDFFGSRWR